TEADDRARGSNVVILSDVLWRRHFGADPSIVGREIRLDDNLFTVLGVMPAVFENATAPAAALWAPLQYDATLLTMGGREWGHHLRTIARLKEAVSVRQASAEVSRIGRGVLSELRPTTYDWETQFAVVPLGDEITRGVRPALLAIAVAVGIVLI